MFTQPSAPFLPATTNSSYDTSFFALAGQGGGSNLPPGTAGAYLYYDGSNWVAQTDPIIIGNNAQGPDVGSITIGVNAITANAGSNNVAIGTDAIVEGGAVGSVAIGYNALVSPNSNNSGVAIGENANVQAQGGVCIGPNSHSGDGITCTSVGINAGNSNNTKNGNVSLGWYAGNANLAGGSANQGAFAVNIGCFAGYAGNGSADNSITINAQGQSGPTVNSLSAEFSSLYVAPILASTMTNYLSYDPVSKLVGYGSPSATPSFNIITQSLTALNTLAGSNVDEFNIASGDLNSLLPSGHSYLITLKFSWDLVQNPADSNFTTTLTSNTFINPQIVYGAGATPTSFAQIGLFTTNYVGSNSYFGGNVAGTFTTSYDNTLSGILNVASIPTNAIYFVLQFAKATYTAPAGAVAINQYNFSAVQLT